MDEDLLMESIRDLRAELGENQITFAVRIGKSYPTVQRYERNTPPAGKELVPFVLAARECGRLDLARIFKAAIVESIPPELIQIIREAGPEDESPAKETPAQSAGDKRKLRA